MIYVDKMFGRRNARGSEREAGNAARKALGLAIICVLGLAAGGANSQPGAQMFKKGSVDMNRDTAKSAVTRRKSHSGADVVLEWDQILLENIPATTGLFSFRHYAMMHIAMFDAINSIEQKYRRYHVQVPADSSASTEAAAAQAAHDVLVALIPAAEATFDEALENRLATIQKNQAARGAAVGRKVAQAILDWRTADGTELPNPPYVPPALPGLWQPTPVEQVAAFVHFGGVEPFGLVTATQFLPDPPPLLNSDEYAENFEEVKAVGSVDSGSRTEEQTLLAKVFAGSGYGPGPFGLWSDVARDIAESRQLSLIEAARMFALINAAMNDGLQTSHTSKFIYNLWRPVTAIQRADEDLNDDTTADGAWMPLLATPPYPSHSSNLTCIGVAAARSLERLFRTDQIPFTVTWQGTDDNADVTRTYTMPSQLAEEGALSRVHGGIHFMFEITDSYESCTEVADYLYENYMRPIR